MKVNRYFPLRFVFCILAFLYPWSCFFINRFLSVCKDFYLRKFENSQIACFQPIGCFPLLRLLLKKFANVLFCQNPEIICEKMKFILKHEY